jgi:hypothetical protein
VTRLTAKNTPIQRDRHHVERGQVWDAAKFSLIATLDEMLSAIIFESGLILD